MKKFLSLLLTCAIILSTLLVPVSAASDATISQDTTLTKKFNVYQNLTIAPGVTLTTKMAGNEPQGIEMHGALTLGAGAKIVGRGIILMFRGSSYSGITLYYIEPVMICVFGTLIFKEKMSGYKKVALVFSAIAVVYILFYYRQVPGIALGLACTFSIYAAIKKDMHRPPMISLLCETLYFAPFALIAIIYMECTGNGALATVAGTEDMYKYWLMLLCGPFTALPLGLYANANNKINMFLLGVSAYLSTTIALVLGIWLFQEPFDRGQLIAFIFIWIGLVFFTYGEFKDYRKLK